MYAPTLQLCIRGDLCGQAPAPFALTDSRRAGIVSGNIHEGFVLSPSKTIVDLRTDGDLFVVELELEGVRAVQAVSLVHFEQGPIVVSVDPSATD